MLVPRRARCLSPVFTISRTSPSVEGQCRRDFEISFRHGVALRRVGASSRSRDARNNPLNESVQRREPLLALMRRPRENWDSHGYFRLVTNFVVTNFCEVMRPSLFAASVPRSCATQRDFRVCLGRCSFGRNVTRCIHRSGSLTRHRLLSQSLRDGISGKSGHKYLQPVSQLIFWSRRSSCDVVGGRRNRRLHLSDISDNTGVGAIPIPWGPRKVWNV
jgi:hypothetical protein